MQACPWTREWPPVLQQGTRGSPHPAHPLPQLTHGCTTAVSQDHIVLTLRRKKKTPKHTRAGLVSKAKRYNSSAPPIPIPAQAMPQQLPSPSTAACEGLAGGLIAPRIIMYAAHSLPRPRLSAVYIHSAHHLVLFKPIAGGSSAPETVCMQQLTAQPFKPLSWVVGQRLLYWHLMQPGSI